MKPELRREMLRILKDLMESKPGARRVLLTLGTEALTRDAALYLEDADALQRGSNNSSYRLKLKGYEIYDQLRSPRLYWIRNNWFAVAVLAVSSIATVSGAVLSAVLR